MLNLTWPGKFREWELQSKYKRKGAKGKRLAIKAAYPEFTWEDLRHNIRAGHKFVLNHGHVHKSMFERRIDDYIGDLKLKHEHGVRYPHSRLDCDIVVKAHSLRQNKRSEKVRTKPMPRAHTVHLHILCRLVMHLESYRKKMQKKRLIAKKHGLELVELYLKDDWREIKKKLKQALPSKLNLIKTSGNWV